MFTVIRATCVRCGNLFPVFQEKVQYPSLRDLERAAFSGPGDVTYAVPGNTVRWVPDPFAEEIYDDKTYKWWCDLCHHDSLMEI